MSKLETAMAILMETFDTYAAKEGNKCTLNKAEVKTLMETEFPGLLKVRYSTEITTEAENGF